MRQRLLDYTTDPRRQILISFSEFMSFLNGEIRWKLYQGIGLCCMWEYLRVIWGRTAVGVLVLLRASRITLTSNETM